MNPTQQRTLEEFGWDGAAELRIGGIPAAELAAQFGTPLYAYDAALVRARAGRVRTALGPDVRVLYSIKANPCVAVARLLHGAGLRAEVASAGELLVAQAAGWDARELRFAGPGKADWELAQALDSNLGIFSIESAAEGHELGRMAAARARVAKVALRVNPAEVSGGRMRMGGNCSRFGVDEDAAAQVLAELRDCPGLELAGLHVYAGTQCFDASAWLRTVQQLVARAAEWEQQLGIQLRDLDCGGGFGVGTFAGDPSFDLQAAAAGLREVRNAPTSAGRVFSVELGRYLVAPAGVYLARVLWTKVSGGRLQAVLDGGLHHCAALAGLGTILKRHPLAVHATALTAAARPVDLGGPLCTPIDSFGEGLELPPLQRGDLVAILAAGAYGLSYSPVRFLGHPTPAEIVVDDGTATLARERGAAGDVLLGQRLGDRRAEV